MSVVQTIFLLILGLASDQIFAADHGRNRWQSETHEPHIDTDPLSEALQPYILPSEHPQANNEQLHSYPSVETHTRIDVAEDSYLMPDMLPYLPNHEEMAADPSFYDYGMWHLNPSDPRYSQEAELQHPSSLNTLWQGDDTGETTQHLPAPAVVNSWAVHDTAGADQGLSCSPSEFPYHSNLPVSQELSAVIPYLSDHGAALAYPQEDNVESSSEPISDFDDHPNPTAALPSTSRVSSWGTDVSWRKDLIRGEPTKMYQSYMKETSYSLTTAAKHLDLVADAHLASRLLYPDPEVRKDAAKTIRQRVKIIANWMDENKQMRSGKRQYTPSRATQLLGRQLGEVVGMVAKATDRKQEMAYKYIVAAFAMDPRLKYYGNVAMPLEDVADIFVDHATNTRGKRGPRKKQKR